MARVQNTLIGRASGAVGQVVFLTWKRLNVTRAKPIDVANPDTLPQQEQRNRFIILRRFFDNNQIAINTGLSLYAKKLIPVNVFFKQNIKTAFINPFPPVQQLVFSKLIIAKGIITPIPISFITAFSITTFAKITWSPEIIGKEMTFSDDAHAIMWNETTDTYFYLSGVKRANEELTVNLSTTFSINDVIHAWLFFVSADGRKVSDSTYLSKIVTV